MSTVKVKDIEIAYSINGTGESLREPDTDRRIYYGQGVLEAPG